MKSIWCFVLSFCFIWSGPSIADEDYARATSYTTKALYKELRVGFYVKQLQDRYLSEDLKRYGGITTWLLKVGVEQRIVFEWRFP